MRVPCSLVSEVEYSHASRDCCEGRCRTGQPSPNSSPPSLQPCISQELSGLTAGSGHVHVAPSGSIPVAHRLATGESDGPHARPQCCGTHLSLTKHTRRVNVLLSGTAALLH